MTRFVAFFVLLFVLAFSVAAYADDAGAPSASVRGCVETIPSGGARPPISETFPERGTSGYASVLVVTIEHGKGEHVLPSGLELQQASESAKTLKEEGWVLPNQDGGGAAHLTSQTTGERTITVFELPLLALPKTPGRHVLTLPPLPIALSRANGDIAVLCTQAHTITVEDPIASTNDPAPKQNPAPRMQREEWTALRNALGVLAIGIVVGIIVAYFVRSFMRRPKPVPPPPPPRPAWEVALERLDEVRHAGLLETARFGEYFDRVNDALRSYLGARYGVGGLEATTDEIVEGMQHVALTGASMPEIIEFLQTCDLVKFANMTPTEDECAHVLVAGENIVRKTTPSPKAIEDASLPSATNEGAP